MSYILEGIQQVRWPVRISPHGAWQLIINRPGVTDLTIADADTLLLSEESDLVNGDYSPFFESDIPFSKKNLTTKGRKALDDLTIQLRDSLGYTGTVNGVATAEKFSSTYQTFFNVWFNAFDAKYKAFILWSAVHGEVAFEGFIDPKYKPNKEPIITNNLSLIQSYVASRTIKIVRQDQAREIVFQDVLNLIGESDCRFGVPYNGWMRGEAVYGDFFRLYQDVWSAPTGYGSGTLPAFRIATPYVDYQYKLYTVNALITAIGGAPGWPVPAWTDRTAIWGPFGTCFIQVGVLLAKCAQALGYSTFDPTTDIRRALGFFRQAPDDADKCYPIDTGELGDTELWINLNVFAFSHPVTGFYWPNPVGFAPETPVLDVVGGICDFLLADFSEEYSSTGVPKLVMKKWGAPAAALPSNFELTSAIEDEPNTSPRVVLVNNKGFGTKTRCPLNTIGDGIAFEVAIQLHRFGPTGVCTTPYIDGDAMMWDSSKKIEEQITECFKAGWMNASNTTDYSVNDNVWKSLAGLYYFNGAPGFSPYGSNVVPPMGESDFDNCFVAVSACYRFGDTPSADLQAEPNGNDYFNSRDFHAVAFAALQLPLPTSLSLSFEGVCDDSGSLVTVGPNMVIGPFWYDNANRTFNAFETVQSLEAGRTDVKVQEQLPANFPALTDLLYGPDGSNTGGTSSGGTATDGGSRGNPPSPQIWITLSPSSLTSNTDDWTINQSAYSIVRISSTIDINLTGIAGGLAGMFLVLINVGTKVITLKNDDGVHSTAGSRFRNTSGDYGLTPQSNVTLFYDATDSRWRFEADGG